MSDSKHITFYYPGVFQVQPDGSIFMRATGWEGDEHWTGQHKVKADAPDFRFWQWVVSQRQRWTSLQFISSDDLPKIRDEYERHVA
jgi:hypothetical protein